MEKTGKSLEDRFTALAGDLAEKAANYMEPESYGQWADETYRLMEGTANSSASFAPAMADNSTIDETITPSVSQADDFSGAFKPAMAGVIAISAPAIKEAQKIVPMMEDVYAASAKMAMDGYYFMSDGEKQDFSKTDMGSPLPASVDGMDVLDLNFLSKMANDMFKGASEFMAVPSSSDTPSAPSGKTPDMSDAPYFMNYAGMANSHVPTPSSGTSAFDVENVRRDFPILQRKVHGKQLIWLDNGATTQKPQVVIDRVSHFYEYENSNVHRGAHTLAAESTDAYEGARAKVAAFLGAPLPEEVIFVRGTTEGINLVANVCGEKFLGSGDEIILTEAEHHANIVPWQFIAQRTGAKIRVAPIDDSGEIIIEEYARLLGPRTKIVSMTHVSNALGTVMPIAEMTAMAKRFGAIVVIDGAQGVPHRRVNVQEIGCDFYVFSGHKLFAPTGIGAVWGRKEIWEEVSPWQGGGSMIEKVTFEKSTFAGLPNKFEAGTGSLASAVGLGAAIDYVSSLGFEAIERYETELVNYAVAEISNIKGVRMIGMPKDRAGVVSFVMNGIPVREIGKLLDADGIAVRAGHHCAQPALAHFGLEATIRPAFAFYNTRTEVDVLVDALKKISFSVQV